MATKLDEAYAELCLKLGGQIPSAQSGVRKLMLGESWTIPHSTLMGGMTPTIEQLGYAPGPSKMKHLCRNYLNEEELISVREKFISRIGKDQTSVTARFGNAEKPGASQGYCMQTITMNLLRRPEPGVPAFSVEIYYRSTEIGKKFLADLHFLKDIVMPILLEGCPIEPEQITFKWNHLYYSSIFLPVFFQFVEPIKLCTHIEANDPHFWNKGFRNALDKYLDPDLDSGYQTMMKSHKTMHQFVIPSLTRPQLRILKRISKK